MSPPADHKIEDLQHLRGVSILLVLLTHFPALVPLLNVFPQRVSNPCWLGVEIFFVLSGYVITHALARDRYEPLSFFVRRVFRLTPALLCFLALCTGVFALFLHGGVPEGEMSRIHGVTKSSAAARAARANGWDEEKAWKDGALNRSWDEIEAGWVQEAAAAGVPTEEATATARTARSSAEARWRVSAWEEYGKQSASVVGGYYILRGMFGPHYPHMSNFLIIWSLSVEDHFYIAVGLVCLVAAVVLRRFAPRALPWVLGVLALALYLYVAVIRFDSAISGDYWGFWKHQSWHRQLEAAAYSPTPVDGQWLARIGYYPALIRFEFLPLGVLAAFFDRRFRPWVRAKLADRGPWLAWPLLLTPLALGALTGTTDNPYYFGWLYLVAGWCFTPLVLIAAHNQLLPNTRGWLARLLRYLGDRSYTLYLLHPPVLSLAWYLVNVLPALLGDVRPWTEWVNKSESGRNELLQSAVALVLLLPLTELVYRLVELPLTRVGKRWGAKLRIIPPEPAAGVAL